MVRRHSRCSVLVVLLCALSSAAFAQQETATIAGTITDSTGAVVPRAVVVVTNVQTGITVRTAATESGSYLVPSLRPGDYSVAVESKGFQKTVRTGVTLQVAQVARIDVTMQTGGLTESVEVVAATPLLDTLTSFALLALVFVPLERLFAAHRTPWLRREFGTDLLFFLGQYLLWTAPVVAALVLVHDHLDALPLTGLRAAVAALPLWLQLVVGIASSDLAIYWAHRWSHQNAFLWRFHRVHHTAEHLDWLAAHREHPFDNLYTRLVENLPLMLLGIPLHVLAGFAVFRGLWSVFVHSNTTLDPGPLRWLLGSPRLHHRHHAIDGVRVNFANLCPLMDLLFGTWCDPGQMPERYGVAEPGPRSYLAQLVAPLWPARRSRPR